MKEASCSLLLAFNHHRRSTPPSGGQRLGDQSLASITCLKSRCNSSEIQWCISNPPTGDIGRPTGMFSALTTLQPRQLATQALNFALILSTAFMLWKGLSVVTDSPSPIVVVLSGSMEPAFQRGDLLFLWNRGRDTQVGEVVVYNVQGKDIPIVHRVVRKFGVAGG